MKNENSSTFYVNTMRGAAELSYVPVYDIYSTERLTFHFKWTQPNASNCRSQWNILCILRLIDTKQMGHFMNHT